MSSIKKILNWWHQFDFSEIMIKTENHEFDIEIIDRRLPHLIGLQYVSKDKIRPRELLKIIEEKEENEIFEMIYQNNPEQLKNVKLRIQYFKFFMENLESAELVEQTHPKTKLKSDFLLVKDDEKGEILQLGIAKDRNDIDYFETFIVRKDEVYFEQSDIKEKVIELKKWEQDKLVPFSFKSINVKENIIDEQKREEQQMSKKVSYFEKDFIEEFENYLFDENSPRWEKPWVSGFVKNGKTETVYQGGNQLLLQLLMNKNGWDDGRFYTFNQAKSLKLKVRKGAKATKISFFQFIDKRTNQPFDFEKLKELSTEEQLEELVHRIPTEKYYNVFNAQDIEGLEKEIEPEIKLTDFEQFQKEFMRNLIRNMNVKFRESEVFEAKYEHDTDTVFMPAMKNFKDMNSYFATLIHELAHATTQKNRLNRNLSYAEEEIVAELSSVFFQGELRLEKELDKERHLAYLKDWYEKAKANNPKFLLQATKFASEIKEYFLEKGEYQKLIEKYEAKLPDYWRIAFNGYKDDWDKEILTTEIIEEMKKVDKKHMPKYYRFSLERVKDGEIIDNLQMSLGNDANIDNEYFDFLEEEVKRYNTVDALEKQQEEQKHGEEWIVEFSEHSGDYAGRKLTNEFIEELKKADEKVFEEKQQGKYLGYDKTFFRRIEDGKMTEMIQIDLGDGNQRTQKKFDELQKRIKGNGKSNLTTPIETIKKEIPIEKFANEELGFSVYEFTENVFGMKEHVSVRIYRNTNTYYRFSTHMGGDIVDFVKEFKQCSNEDAITMLTNYYEKNKDTLKEDMKLKEESVEKNEIVVEKEKEEDIKYLLTGKSEGNIYKTLLATEENYQILLKEAKQFDNYKIGLFDKKGHIKSFIEPKEVTPTNLKKDLFSTKAKKAQKQKFWSDISKIESEPEYWRIAFNEFDNKYNTKMVTSEVIKEFKELDKQPVETPYKFYFEQIKNGEVIRSTSFWIGGMKGNKINLIISFLEMELERIEQNKEKLNEDVKLKEEPIEKKELPLKEKGNTNLKEENCMNNI